MKQDVKLFINNELVDYSDELSMPFIYQLEDTNNPSAVKNSWTKSITIIGTKQNNKIFGSIYNLDREQLYSNEYITGVYFNPSFRTPFSIYRNGDLIESGYMQLNNITLKDKLINYNITLYGGLGDFFYKLKYNDNNEQLKLSDLYFGVNGSTNENEFNVVLNKDLIKRCWDNIDSTDKNFEYFINFAPAENGIYENFDNDKVLINFKDSEIFESAVTKDNKTYVSYRGYALGELNKEYDEWEMCSLRSSQQRPVLRVKGLFDAICNPINNGGYNVELDSDFFNDNNPYYNNAYIALPLLESTIDFDGELETEEGLLQSKVNGIGVWVGQNGQNTNTANALQLIPQSPINTTSDGYIAVDEYPVSTFFDLTVDFQLFFDAVDYTSSDLFLSCVLNGKSNGINFNNHPQYNSVLVQLVVYDVDNPFNIVGFSDWYNFTNETPAGVFTPTNGLGFINLTNANVTNVLGKFVYDYNSGKHFFLTESGDNTFRLTAKNVSKEYNNLAISLNISKMGNNPNSMFKNTINQIAGNVQSTNGFWYNLTDNERSEIVARWNGDTVLTNSPITKQQLLKTENAPLDYLLSYTKQFGLYFSKDITNDTIRIQQRNNFFNGQIVDINDRIDYSKDIVINPIVFDKKYYRLTNNEVDNYYLGKYKKEYGVSYGQKRLNTNYNFNAETEDLLKNSVFNNAISVVDTSNYYRNFYDSDNNNVPAFVVDNLTYKLSYINEETEIEVYGSNIINLSKTKKWNIKTGYDFTDKLGFYNYDNNVKNLAEINSCLVFYNGKISPKTIDGDDIPIWLTDDVQEMYQLNEKRCHLYTNSEYNILNQRIAYKLNEIPKFGRYKTSGNNIVASMDFAVPKEFYLFNTNYPDTSTIYQKYMADFYADQLDINTKKVTAYVNLNGLKINSDSLRNFYYFNNCIWILNKIDGYDINNFNTVKCEFIKVNNISNYTKQLGL